MSFITSLLTKSDSSLWLATEVKDGSYYHAFVETSAFCKLLIFSQRLAPNGWFLLVSTLFFKCDCRDANLLRTRYGWCFSTNYQFYLFSLTLAYLINFSFNICFGFSAFVFKNLWGSNLFKNSLVAFMSGSLIPLFSFPKIVSDILSFLPFHPWIYTPLWSLLGNTTRARFFMPCYSCFGFWWWWACLRWFGKESSLTLLSKEVSMKISTDASDFY